MAPKCDIVVKKTNLVWPHLFSPQPTHTHTLGINAYTGSFWLCRPNLLFQRGKERKQKHVTCTNHERPSFWRSLIIDSSLVLFKPIEKILSWSQTVDMADVLERKYLWLHCDFYTRQEALPSSENLIFTHGAELCLLKPFTGLPGSLPNAVQCRSIPISARSRIITQGSHHQGWSVLTGIGINAAILIRIDWHWAMIQGVRNRQKLLILPLESESRISVVQLYHSMQILVQTVFPLSIFMD